MPIPKPSSGESESDFMARCTGDSTMLAEYSQRDQRVAVCLSSYREGGKEETVMDEALVEDFTDDFDDEIPNGIFFSFSSLLSFLFSSPESPFPLHPR